MSSRRRPVTRSTLDDDFSRSSNYTDTSSEPVSNSLRRAYGGSTAEDFVRFLDKRRTSLHPATTDYGPESLLNFIQDEVRKLEPSQQQDKELRDLLQALVNAEQNIQLVKGKDGNYFAPVTKEAHSKEGHSKEARSKEARSKEAHSKDNNNSFLDKGKAPIRKGQQAFLKIVAQTVRTLPATTSLSTTIHTRSSKSIKPATGVRYDKLEEDGDNDVLADPRPSKTITSKYGRGEKTTGYPLGDPEIDRAGIVPATRPKPPFFFTKKPETPSSKEKVTKSSVNSESTSSRRLTRSSLPSRKPLGQEVRSQFDGTGSVTPALRQRPRASSFESHAKQFRQTQRSRTKAPENDSHAVEGSPRPRKMSASLHASLNPAAAPFVPQQPSMLPLNVLDSNTPLLPSFAITEAQAASQVESSSSAAKFSSRRHRSFMTIPEPACSIQTQDQAQDIGAEVSLSYGDMEPEISRRQLDPSEEDPDTSAAYVQEQQAIFASLTEGWNRIHSSVTRQDGSDVPKFDYTAIVPEDLPNNIRQAEINRRTILQEHGLDCHGVRNSKKVTLRHSGPYPIAAIDPGQKNLLNAPDSNGDYRRFYPKPPPSVHLRQPPFCPPSKEPRTTLPNVIWEEGVLDYLSSAEVRHLRLVCRSIAEDLEPYVFRSVVTRFSPSMFNLILNPSNDTRIDINASDSMLRKYGPDINKFGIAFEYDFHGLVNAPFKTTETTVNAWFGRYQWPVREYPYFRTLKEIDQILDDDRRLLTQALKKLTNCSELALSLDSGHGWLEGPDVSDLALYRQRIQGGSRVFGKTFSADDKCYEDGLRQLFRWAQVNTINDNIKYLTAFHGQAARDLARLRAIVIRDYDSFCIQAQQPDFERHLHTGGAVTDNAQSNAQNQPPNLQHNNNVPYLANAFQNLFNAGASIPASLRARRSWSRSSRPQRVADKPSPDRDISRIQPQWPLIFSGYNLSAESRGDTNFVQRRVAAPSAFPLLPGQITEAQAQWMMESAWIQRTFLTAYTDAVRLNTQVLRTVHTLNLAKISSGLLPSLSQQAFWSALPGLRKITIMVKPDWRVEHTPGDKLYSSSMLTDPVNASLKFAELLRNCVARLENLYTLHIGYVGGGEHQCGLYGRNQHVLPAPITHNPREWLLAYHGATSLPSNNSMFTFNHVRNLRFENCWFSPSMLDTFMSKSRDTSLHNLTLESVSLTARINSTRTDGPLQTIQNNLKCTFSPASWLNETIPDNASWVHVLDKVTPGRTILDRKYAAQMIDEEENPKPEPEFRGNIQRITLRSCGYVKIQGISSTDFNQNELVFQNSSWCAMDEGLRVRASNDFTKITYRDVCADDSHYDNNDYSPSRRSGRTHLSQYPRLSHQRSASASSHWSSRFDDEEPSQDKQTQQRQSESHFIMIAGRAGTNFGDLNSQLTEGSLSRPSLTGYLTQCIHPAEKRILERCWGMKFGWGDDMKRWEAVEDGWFMGGTGRFSGEVYRKEADQASAVAEADAELDHEDSAGLSRGAASYDSANGRADLNLSDDGDDVNDSDEAGINDDLDDDDDYDIDTAPILNSARANETVPGAFTSSSRCTNQTTPRGFDTYCLGDDDVSFQDEDAARDDLQED